MSSGVHVMFSTSMNSGRVPAGLNMSFSLKTACVGRAASAHKITPAMTKKWRFISRESRGIGQQYGSRTQGVRSDSQTVTGLPSYGKPKIRNPLPERCQRKDPTGVVSTVTNRSVEVGPGSQGRQSNPPADSPLDGAKSNKSVAQTLRGRRGKVRTIRAGRMTRFERRDVRRAGRGDRGGGFVRANRSSRFR